MKKCKKCGMGFEPVKGLNDYCSLKCRNSRNWTDADKQKKSASAKASLKVATENANRDAKVYQKIAANRLLNDKTRILSADYKDLKFQQLRKRILYEQDGKCNKCRLDEWLGQPLSLELEHKDGNHLNNERSNLEMLCPNCRSLTDTWRGRNCRKANRVNDEDLLSALLDNQMNMRQALLQVGLSPKGGNYGRCHKLVREYNATVAE